MSPLLVFAVGDGLVQPEALNKKAIQIINRVRDKLTGKFGAVEIPKGGLRVLHRMQYPFIICGKRLLCLLMQKSVNLPAVMSQRAHIPLPGRTTPPSESAPTPFNQTYGRFNEGFSISDLAFS